MSLKHFNALKVHSHSLAVTGSVHKILSRICMFVNSVFEQWLSALGGLAGRSPSHSDHLLAQQSNSASREGD